jgi:hypothetical protein
MYMPASTDLATERIDAIFDIERWTTFTRFLNNGRICLTNNATERALRGFVLGASRGYSPGSDGGASALPRCPR